MAGYSGNPRFDRDPIPHPLMVPGDRSLLPLLLRFALHAIQLQIRI
jgi:hypothetical protein